MLAEMALASAAFSTIKQFVADGKEIYEMGDTIAQYFSAKKEIQEKAHKNGYKSDLQAFMAAEQLKAQEDELKQMMIYQGRSGMWDDWLKFQSDAKAEREEKERQATIEKVRKQKKMKQMIEYAVAGIISVVIIGASVWGLFYVIAEYGTN
jgi:hypothetical protein